MTPEAETPSLQLLVGATIAWVASDFVWIWLTLMGSYVPGSSADTGWLVFYALSGAAALHPSMRVLAAPRDARAADIRWPFLALLAMALLGSTAITGYGLLLKKEVNSAGTVAITSVLSLLVVTRLALLLRAEQRLRHELDLRNERLLELDRMKDGFVASVSHDLRTPLTSIRGFTTTLTERWPQLADKDKLTFLHTIDSQAKRLNRLVDSVLLLSKIRAGRMSTVREPLDLADTAREAVDRARARRPDRGQRRDRGSRRGRSRPDPPDLRQPSRQRAPVRHPADSHPDREGRPLRDRSRVRRRGRCSRRVRSPPLRQFHASVERSNRARVRPRPRNRQRAGGDRRRGGLVRAPPAARRLLHHQARSLPPSLSASALSHALPPKSIAALAQNGRIDAVTNL